VRDLGLQNVVISLGEPHDPSLPADSLDIAIMVHMYHEIAQPYALLSFPKIISARSYDAVHPRRAQQRRYQTVGLLDAVAHPCAVIGACARCHRKIVSGFTTRDMSSGPGQIRVIHTNNARSLPYSRSRSGARLNAMLS
jgi:hypothetical protein